MPDNTQKRPVGLTKFGKVVTVGSALMIGATQAQAAITAPDFSDPIANIAILLGAGVAFGALIWGSRKLLSFLS